MLINDSSKDVETINDSDNRIIVHEFLKEVEAIVFYKNGD